MKTPWFPQVLAGRSGAPDHRSPSVGLRWEVAVQVGPASLVSCGTTCYVQPMGHVYLSSTWEDLKDFRRAAADAVRKIGHVPIGMEDYAADDRRPVRRCLDDIERCNAYVGIFAWRRGFLPEEGGGRSITEMEYEHAGTVGIPRLIFLSPDRDAWDARLVDDSVDRMMGLRKRLDLDHSRARFSSDVTLQVEVMAAVSRAIGTGAPVPELLPYLCDRSVQLDTLSGALTEATGRGGASPVVVVVHGREEQALGKFLDVLRDDALVGRRGSARIVAREFQITWPTARPGGDYRKHLVANVAQAVCEQRWGDEDAVRTALGQIPDPVLLTSWVDAGTCDAQWCDRIRTLAALVLSWPARQPAAPLVVALAVHHPPRPGALARLLRIGRVPDVAGAVAQLGPTVCVLPELPDVERSDVDQWQRRPQVREWTDRWCADADLAPDLDALFDGGRALPMNVAARGLRGILERGQSRRGSA